MGYFSTNLLNRPLCFLCWLFTTSILIPFCLPSWVLYYWYKYIVCHFLDYEYRRCLNLFNFLLFACLDFYQDFNENFICVFRIYVLQTKHNYTIICWCFAAHNGSHVVRYHFIHQSQPTSSTPRYSLSFSHWRSNIFLSTLHYP